MIHNFTMHGDYFCYDIESGNLLELDKLSYELLNKKSGKNFNLDGYNDSEILEAENEIEKLISEEIIFADSLGDTISTRSEEIKALCLHICHDCNLKCKYCFADEGKYQGEAEYMSLDVGMNAVDFLIANSGHRKNLEIDFFGGEPLMNLDVVKGIVVYAKLEAEKHNKIFKFTMTTNCILLNDDVIDYLNEEMENVVLSIDGRKSIHDEVRKTINDKGSFDIALKNSLKFKEKRGNKSYYVRGTFTSLNTDFHKDILHLNDLGFDQISIEPVVLDDNHVLALKDKHIKVVNENYEKLAKEYVLRRKDGDKWFNFFHFFLDMDNSPCLTKRYKGCGAGNEYLAVSPFGDIYPCHQFVGRDGYVMGNVFEKKLSEQLKTKFSCSNLNTKKDCEDCFAKYNCSGGCPSNNISYAGDIDKPYKLSCEMMKKRFECSLYVYSKEN